MASLLPAVEEPQLRGRDDLIARLGLAVARSRITQIAMVYAVVIIATGVFGPIFFGHIATAADFSKRLAPPFTLDSGWEYVLGGDGIGRSLLARLVVATRTTLTIAVLAVGAAAVLGSALGLLSGYRRGGADATVMRVIDIMLSFPTLLLAVFVLYTVNGGILTIILVLAVTRSPIFVRFARAEALALRERTFVRAAVALGASPARIIFRHLVPNMIWRLSVVATLEFATIMLAESGLSFLGIGVRAPDVTWGILVAEGQNYISSAWWVALFPGLLITLTAASVVLLADWLRAANDSA